MSRPRLPKGGAEGILPLGPVIAVLPQPHSSVPLLLMEAEEQVSGHSPINSQASVLEPLFKIDVSFGSDVHGTGVEFRIAQFKKNYTVLILGELYI